MKIRYQIQIVGIVKFCSKTALILHYEHLGRYHETIFKIILTK